MSATRLFASGMSEWQGRPEVRSVAIIVSIYWLQYSWLLSLDACFSYKLCRNVRYSLNLDSMELDNSSTYDAVRRLTNSDSLVKNPYFPNVWKIYWWNNLSWEEYSKVNVSFFLFFFTFLYTFHASHCSSTHLTSFYCFLTSLTVSELQLIASIVIFSSCLFIDRFVGCVRLAVEENERKGDWVFLPHLCTRIQAGLHQDDPDQYHHRVWEKSSLQTDLPLPWFHAASPTVGILDFNLCC